MKKVNDYIKIHPTFLDKVNLDELTFFYNARLKFKNGIYYDFTYRKFSYITGYSYKKSKKYIDILLSHDMIYFRNGHLCFRSIEKIAGLFMDRVPKKGYKFIKVNKHSLTHKDIKRKLFLSGIIHKKSQQDHIISDKRICSKLISGKRLKMPTRRMKKLLDLNRQVESGNFIDENVINTRMLAKYFGISQSIASKLMRENEDAKLISTQKLIIKLGKSNTADVYTGYRGFHYLHRGILYVYTGTAVSLLDQYKYE